MPCSLPLMPASSFEGFFIINQDRTDAPVDAMVHDCRRIVAERSVALDVLGPRQGMNIQGSSCR